MNFAFEHACAAAGDEPINGSSGWIFAMIFDGV